MGAVSTSSVFLLLLRVSMAMEAMHITGNCSGGATGRRDTLQVFSPSRLSINCDVIESDVYPHGQVPAQFNGVSAGRPRDFRVEVVVTNGTVGRVPVAVVNWKPPALDLSHLRGFLLRMRKITGPAEDKTSFSRIFDLSRNTFKASDNSMEFRDIFSGLETGPRLLYQALLYSLPCDRQPQSLYFSLPEVQERQLKAADWSPVITCKPSRNSELPSYRLSVSFTLAPARFRFREFIVSLYVMSNLHNALKMCKLNTERQTSCGKTTDGRGVREIPNLARNNAKSGFVIFEGIRQDHYMVEVQAVDPYWQYDKHALCFSVLPSGKRVRMECLRTRLKGIQIGGNVDDVAVGEDGISRQLTSSTSQTITTNPTVGPTAPSSGTIERKDIECTGATMDIHIPRSLLPTHKVTLRDPTCVVPSNGTHYIISVSFNQCGTTVSFSNDTVVFNNELVATVIQGSNPSTIIDYGLGKDDQRVSLECVYKRHSTVELNYRPLMKAAHFYEKRYGMLDFEVKQYSDEQFTSEITQTNVPTGVVLNREIFIDLIVDQRQANDIGIEVPSCFATPTPSPTDSLYYPLIKSSCPAQTDVRTFTSPNINEFRFSFLAFKFTRAPLQKIDATLPAVPMVYIHCQVSACPRGNCSSSCAQGRRVKRAAIEDSTHLISSGPFYLKTDESSTGYSSIVVGVTMSIAVAATVVAMAAIVAWRRSAAALSAYKSLPMNINS